MWHLKPHLQQLLTLIMLEADIANTKWHKKLKNDWNPGVWVLIWEYSAGAI